MQRSEYLALRNEFQPDSVRLVIVAESLPTSGKYFYNPTGAITEPLFVALMQQLGFAPDTKESGLREFQRRGWVLIDATYEPVNALRIATRDNIIQRDYPLLRDDLAALLPDRSAWLILLKANVCRLLERREFIALLAGTATRPACKDSALQTYEKAQLEFGLAMTRYGIALGQRWAKVY